MIAMSKPIKTLLLALLLATGSAWAEWVKVGGNDGINIYIDPASIRKDGNLRRVWMIQDSKQRDKEGLMSMRMRREYDCKQERARFLFLSSHSEPMAGGTSNQEGVETRWNEIPPDTLEEDILKLVCAK